MEIGKLSFRHGLFLAPMAGTTDLAFRLLCRREGCELAYTEMVSAKALSFDNQKTKTLLEMDEREGLAAVQLFGSNPELLAEMAEKIDNPRIAFFDVNMGCPVPKIVNNGEGSALMRQPDLVGAIVAAMTKRLKKPVTVKIRKGVDKEHVNAVEIAENCRGCRSSSNCSAWQDGEAVLQRTGGLGDYSAGESGGSDSGDWERGYFFRSSGAANAGTNGL